MNDELWSEWTDRAKFEWLRQQVKSMPETCKKLRKDIEDLKLQLDHSRLTGNVKRRAFQVPKVNE